MSISDWFRKRTPAPERGRGGLSVADVTADQRDTIFDIVSIFETGKPLARAPYDTVTILADGGGISYGCHQAAARGALPAVIDNYYARGGILRIGGDPITAIEAKEIAARSTRVKAAPPSGEIRALMTALERAGQEPVMAEAQRHVFERDYWAPAVAVWRELDCRYALTLCALYDLCIQSGPPRSIEGAPYTADTRSRLYKLRYHRYPDGSGFDEFPPSDSRSVGERKWTLGLLRARYRWLGDPYDVTDPQQRVAMKMSRYRVGALYALGARDHWDLRTPFDMEVPYKQGPVTYKIGASPLDPPPTPRRVA